MARMRVISASNAGSTASCAMAARAPQIRINNERRETRARLGIRPRAYTSVGALPGRVRLSARQACGVSALSVGALILARHRPQVAVAVVDVRALADLALYGLGLAVPPGVATVLGQFRGLGVAHFRLLKLGIFVGKAHHTPLPIAPRRGPTPAAGAPAQGGEERCEQQDLQQGDGAAHGNTRGDLFIQ